MVALSLVGALVAAGGEALAWGPVTHQKIMAEARDEMGKGGIRGLWLAYPRYMYGGAIAPSGVWPMPRRSLEWGMLKKLPPTRVISIAPGFSPQWRPWPIPTGREPSIMPTGLMSSRTHMRRALGW